GQLSVYGDKDVGPESLSSLRKQGPITTGLGYAKAVSPQYPKRGRGVWVPAFAGTTRSVPQHLASIRPIFDFTFQTATLCTAAAARSRRAIRASFALTSRPLHRRARGTPGARCARSLACDRR